MELVSIGRAIVEIPLYDSPQGVVKLYSSLTVDQQGQLMKKYGTKVDDVDKQMEMSYETVTLSFIDWNIGKDGVALPCTAEVLKQFTMRDFFAMLQACSGRKLLDAQGNVLSPEDIEKKEKSA